MAGTKEGAKTTAATNKEKYGSDYYKRIGAMGGRKKVPKGFSMRRDVARIAGAKGGRISRLPKKIN